MKPIVTWVVLANARQTRSLENQGIGKGLTQINGSHWKAAPASDFASRPGSSHSIAGHGSPAMDQGDPQFQADLLFAKEIGQAIENAFNAKKFDRIILVSGPYMMGLLRQHLSAQVRDVVLAEVTKDLSALPTSEIEKHLGEFIAV